jgi:membrane-bound lytic murein transglycosylase A
MRAALRALALCAVTAIGGGAAAEQVLHFEELDGWAQDDHRAALLVFRETCDLLKAPEWGPLCKFAQDVPSTPEAARGFFELFFRPVLIGAPPALFTGYYEPELAGSPVRTPRFAYPLYAKPPEMREGMVWRSRAEIESGILRGRGLEVAWLDDPVEAYFLMVQGSGRIVMPDGSTLRLGYGGKNGHPYRSIGQELIRRGTHRLQDVSAQSIKAWVRGNPAAGAALLNHNPSYVFFRKLPDLPPEKGPIGAMGR